MAKSGKAGSQKAKPGAKKKKTAPAKPAKKTASKSRSKPATKPAKKPAAQPPVKAVKQGAALKKKAIASAKPQTSKPLRLLRMALEHDDDNLMVHWSIPDGRARSAVEGENGYSWAPYYVSKASIEGPSTLIRKHLQDLQGLAWDTNAPTALADTYAPILARLIDAGSKLHDGIMEGIDDDSKEAAKPFQDWFKRNVLSPDAKANWRIEVVHTTHREFIAPWALACTPISRAELAKLDPRKYGDYDRFWGARFQVSVRGVKESNAESDDIIGDHIGLACVLELDEQAVAEVGKWHDKDVDRQSVQDHFGWDRDTFQRIKRDQVSHHLFWYLSLRHNGGAVKLIDADLVERVKQRNLSPTGRDAVRVVIMLIDGDAIVRNDRGTKWLDSALTLGRAGLIAVEADIDNKRLRHFGWRILEHVLLCGKPLLEGVSEARAEFWPLGLLYGVYCNPVHTKVDPPPRGMIEQIGNLLTKFRAVQDGVTEAR